LRAWTAAGASDPDAAPPISPIVCNATAPL